MVWVGHMVWVILYMMWVLCCGWYGVNNTYMMWVVWCGWYGVGGMVWGTHLLVCYPQHILRYPHHILRYPHHKKLKWRLRR